MSMNDKKLTDASFNKRASAARYLTRMGRLDGDLALSYVIWPDPDTFKPLILKHATTDRRNP